ncbi:MAG: 30S ribosomal protein S9 [Bacteroidetes bacterium]|nr:30S ribosomal protein S9 [Bacteroidota bacterium]
MKLINTVGRRKTSIARIYMKPGNGEILINKKDYKQYFPTFLLQHVIDQPMNAVEEKDKYDIKINVKGGGVNSQAEAVRMAVARALCEVNSEYRPTLKKEGFLKRDPRMVERKKYGRRKARRGFQWCKR